MADSKLTALTENSAPVSTDLIYMVDDPSGSPLSQKATFANARKALVAGSDTQVQFNDGGSFGGDALLIWDKATEKFTVGDVALTAPFFQLTYSSATLAALNAFRTQFFWHQSLVNALAANSVFNWFYSEDSSTDGANPSDLLTNLSTTIYVGKAGAALVGTRVALSAEVVIEGAGNAANEYAQIFGVTRADIGTGFTQTAVPVGKIWGCDLTVLGSIAARPATLNGIVQVINNYYNGSPLDSASAGMWIVTKGNSGGGLDATHSAATSYPIDVGIGIVGQSSSSGVGFTKGMQIGGTGSPWGESASKIGTGIHVRDYTTYGLLMDNPSGTPTADIAVPTKMTIGGKLVSIVEWQEPQGLRLSLTTNVYVTTSDVTAAGTLYWTTALSGGYGTVTGYNGSVMARKTVQQKSLSLTLTDAKNYDVFYDYDGDALALSAAWTNDTTRDNALADEQGAIVLGSDHTKLWLGTIRASGSNITEDSDAKRFVCNAYNQVPRSMYIGDATSHTFTSVQEWRAGTQLRLQLVLGSVQSITQFVNVRAVNPADNRVFTNLDGTDGDLNQRIGTTVTDTYGGLAFWIVGIV